MNWWKMPFPLFLLFLRLTIVKSPLCIGIIPSSLPTSNLQLAACSPAEACCVGLDLIGLHTIASQILDRKCLLKIISSLGLAVLKRNTHDLGKEITTETEGAGHPLFGQRRRDIQYPENCYCICIRREVCHLNRWWFVGIGRKTSCFVICFFFLERAGRRWPGKKFEKNNTELKKKGWFPPARAPWIWGIR